MGLTSKLNAPTGGIEKATSLSKTGANADQSLDSLHIRSIGTAPTSIQPGEVQVERDPESGHILRVIRPVTDAQGKRNPLNDPLNDLSDSGEAAPSHQASGIIPTLEAQASEEASRSKKKRHQSKREEEWIEKLVAKHGDNFRAMSRDRKLNVMQQSEGDLKRRVGRWKQARRDAQCVA